MIPLNVDPYFTFSLQSANVAPFANTLGILDGQGVGVAKLCVPLGLQPSLAGLVLHHAWVGFDLTASSLAVVSAPKALALLP